MKVNDTLVVENNMKYTLINETIFEEDKYFLAYPVKEDGSLIENEPTILKYVEEQDEIFVDIILNKDLLEQVQKQF